jgi:hypothetical protein
LYTITINPISFGTQGLSDAPREIVSQYKLFIFSINQ